MTESEIIKNVKNLNTDKNSNIWSERTLGKAPHKPFLLLSIINGLEIGWIQSTNIDLNQNLIETFSQYWNQVMGKNRKTTIALPFFHMKSEPFWELIYKEGMKSYKNSPSLGGLIKRLAYANIDDDLFKMIQDEEGREKIISVILQDYFSKDIQDDILKISQLNIGAYNYAQQLELLVAEPFENNHKYRVSEKNYTTYKKLKRRYGFSINVRNNYEHRCALCRAKVRTPNGESLVEAAHIIPFNDSLNDDPRNGLALCKTHHWMFDSYLLTVKPNYSIKLSNWLKQNGENLDNTIAFDHKKIIIPNQQQFSPSEEALNDHYERFKRN